MSVLGLLIGLPITVFAVDIALKQGVMIAPMFSVTGVGFGIAAVVLAVAAASTWFPARKAAAVDPALALKAE
jgi:ABC-type antimicrobial peptide transport system permease subunit